MFGYTYLTLESIDIDYDLASIGICVDDENGGFDEYTDFEGF